MGKYTIRLIRLQRGLTQKQFADKIEMSVNTFIYKERRNQFYHSEVVKICEVFDIDIKDIDHQEIDY